MRSQHTQVDPNAINLFLITDCNSNRDSAAMKGPRPSAEPWTPPPLQSTYLPCRLCGCAYVTALLPKPNTVGVRACVCVRICVCAYAYVCACVVYVLACCTLALAGH